MSATAAAAIAARRRRYIRRFREAGAISPQRAVSLAELDISDGMIFNRLVRQGVFVEVSEGRYYLDEETEAVLRRRRHKIALGFLIVIALLIIIGYLLVPKPVL